MKKDNNDDVEQEKLKIATSSGVASVQLLLRPGFDLMVTRIKKDNYAQNSLTLLHEGSESVLFSPLPWRP